MALNACELELDGLIKTMSYGVKTAFRRKVIDAVNLHLPRISWIFTVRQIGSP